MDESDLILWSVILAAWWLAGWRQNRKQKRGMHDDDTEADS